MVYRENKKSFTLIEMMVTVSVIIFITAISFSVYHAYRSHSSVERGIYDMRDLVVKTQNLAVSPDSPIASHYILYLNAHEKYTRTPGFQAFVREDDPNRDACLHLPPNGGWCIMAETNTSSIKPYINGVVQPCGQNNGGLCLMEGIERHNVTSGKIDLENATITASAAIGPPAGGVNPSCTGGNDGVGDCGYAPNCDYWHSADPQNPPDVKCEAANEEGIIKIHFRVWDGAAGINGIYSDQPGNAGFFPSPLGLVTYTVTGPDGKNKTLSLNLYTGSVQIQ